MKMVSKEIAYGISNLSKMSYEQSKYPSQWKIGKVKVLYKGGDCADCGNYRPLTMLSIPSKVVESVLCGTIDPHLNEVLHDNQWGYRRGLSSESLLLYLTETWNHHIDQGKVIGAIFIDFRKAFDSVCPAILSHKLQACGISGNLFQWLNSYLSDRHQFVELNGVKSPALEVKYGVPQGSLLGPRLFSIYVNDFPDCITQGELHLYADDTTAFVVGDNPDDVTIKLNCLFKEICTFCTLNKLTLHSGKSEVMIIQRDQFVGPLLPVTHGGTQIDYTTKTKLVGVVIDNKLTWKDQLEKTHKSLSSQYRVLKKMKYLSPKLLEAFYFRAVIPQITYCISVWGNCSVAKLYEIENLHIKVGRFIHRVPQNILESEVLSYIKWQDLGYLYKRRLAIEVFKVKHGLNHRLMPFFTFTESKRRGVLLEVKRKKTELGRNSFSYRGIVVWNSLDRRTRNLEKLNALKVALNHNKTSLNKITFNKGTTVNFNKDINFLYY